MIDTKGKEQPGYIVQDTRTGEKYVTYESYAKKLQKDGSVKIVDEVRSGKQMIQEGDGKSKIR